MIFLIEIFNTHKIPSFFSNKRVNLKEMHLQPPFNLVGDIDNKKKPANILIQSFLVVIKK